METIILVTKLNALVGKLKIENANRNIAINDVLCSEYSHTVLVHKYNNTLEIIKQLEEILRS